MGPSVSGANDPEPVQEGSELVQDGSEGGDGGQQGEPFRGATEVLFGGEVVQERGAGWVGVDTREDIFLCVDEEDQDLYDNAEEQTLGCNYGCGHEATNGQELERHMESCVANPTGRTDYGLERDLADSPNPEDDVPPGQFGGSVSSGDEDGIEDFHEEEVGKEERQEQRSEEERLN